jgi:AraC-like DNA-binding protein
MLLDTSQPFSVIGVSFKAGGGFPFLPMPAARFRILERALLASARRAEVDWTRVAHSCGYFDQAHFIHDFREFAGVSPSAYLRDRASRNHIAVRD